MSWVRSLEAQHVQKLKAFELDLDDRLVTKVIGENGAGKSTVLNLFNWLRDTRSVPSEIVTHGEKRAIIQSEVELTEDDFEEITIETKTGAWIIKKTFNPSGANLSVYPKPEEGRSPSPIKSPQDFLDKVFGPVSFNPLTFCDSTKDKQQELLFSVIPGFKDKLDDIRNSYQEKYERRTDINREIKYLQGNLSKIPKTEEIKYKDPVAIMDKYKSWSTANKYNDEKRKELSDLTQEVEDLVLDGKRLREEERSITEQITKLNERLVEVKTLKAEKKKDYENKRGGKAVLETVIKKLKDYDLTLIEDELKSVEETNKQFNHWEASQKLNTDLLVQTKLQSEINLELDSLNKEKADLLKNADYPIKGLEYTEEGIRYDGTLIENLSRAEKLLIGLSVMSRTNPKLKLAIIDDGDRLVGKSKEAVVKWAEENKIPVLIGLASDDPDETGVIIEDGEIIRNDYEDVF